MLTSIRGPLAATLSAGLVLTATPAFASETTSEELIVDETVSEEPIAAPAVVETARPALLDRAIAPVIESEANELAEGSGFELSGNVAFTTEYRFRGVDLSGGEFAVQGGFDLSHSSGFYVGTWASNLDEQTVGFGSTELDLYGGWSGELGGVLSADVGVIAYLYPDAGPGDFDYVEFYGSLSVEVGPASVTGGVAYAPDQDSLGGTDNLYLYTDVGVGISGTPLTINGHLGYTDGFLTFTTDSEAIDWSIGVDVAVGPVTLTGAYVGVEGDAIVDPGRVFTDNAFVLTVAASF